MSTSHCFTPVQFCRTRVTLLLPSGQPDAGTESIVVSDAAIDFGYDLVIKEGAKFEQENGCGDLCLSFQDRDQIQAVNLTTTLCKLDFALIALMTGASLDVIDDIIRGYAVPDIGSDLDREVSVEGWAKAYDVDEPALIGGDVAYYRYIWPRTTWVLGGTTLENNPIKTPLKGRGKSNSGFGDGPANDLTYGFYTTPHNVFLDTEALPEATCGYQELVAS